LLHAEVITIHKVNHGLFISVQSRSGTETLNSRRTPDIQWSGDEIGLSGTGWAQLYHRCDDGLEIVVKLFGEFDWNENCRYEREINKLMNVAHSCIGATFGFVLPIASKELKIARLYTWGGSLKDFLSARALWWTSTANAIAVARIVLGMEFPYSFALIHGDLKPSNGLFDEYDRI
jgi:serine/threonine protein kinase